MDSLPEFLNPRLRVFLSADIVGSTALKQVPRERLLSTTEWSSIIQGFYAEIQSALKASWEDKTPAVQSNFDCGDPPGLWKVIGDEAVFVKILTDYRQLSVTLACWSSAVQQVRKYVRSRNIRLDVKCTVWTAGFPVMNKEVVVPKTGHGLSEDYFRESGEILNKKYRDEPIDGYTIDYIGPAIDIGFRLSAHASSRKMVLSVGAAYVLSLTNSLKRMGLEDHSIHYDGSTPLKGVFGGSPYPIFWIDMAIDGDIAKIEDQMIHRDKVANSVIASFCEKYYEENSQYTFIPFIESDGGKEIGSRPGWYNAALSQLAKNYEANEVLNPQGEAEAEAEGEARDKAGNSTLTLEDGKLDAPLALDAQGPKSKPQSLEKLLEAFMRDLPKEAERPKITAEIKIQRKSKRRRTTPKATPKGKQ